LKKGWNEKFAPPPPQSHIKEIDSHNFLKSSYQLDISEIKNLYKVKHPLKFEQLAKRKKFIHLFWNIIAIFGSLKNIILGEDICHF